MSFQQAVHVVSRERFAELLQCPLGGGVRGDTALQDAAGDVRYEHKHVQEMKRRGDYHAEITGDNSLGMVVPEGPPALGRRTCAWAMTQTLRQVLAYRTRRDPETQLEEQFIRHDRQQLPNRVRSLYIYQ